MSRLLPATRNTRLLSGKKAIYPPNPPSDRMSVLLEVPITLMTLSGTPGVAGQPTWSYAGEEQASPPDSQNCRPLGDMLATSPTFGRPVMLVRKVLDATLKIPMASCPGPPPGPKHW